MEYEERAILESRYQSELEAVRNEVSRMTNLLEQLLRAKNGEGTSTQPPIGAPSVHVPGVSQNLGVDSVTGQHFAPTIPIQPPQAHITADRPSDNRSTGFMNDDKISALEERLRAAEGNDWFDPMRASEICLVPNITVPKDFRIPEFIRYTGLECPNTHLRSYCNKMAEVIHDDKLLIYFFQDSLSGSALSWYMRLENAKIKKWKDLVEAFLKQYKFNLEIAPDRTSLISMEKRSQESVRAYAQRWRDEAMHVQPPLIETEMVTLFANTFKAPYYKHLMGSSAQHFYDVVRITERIEQGIKAGCIIEPLETKGFFGRKLKGPVNNFEGGSNDKITDSYNPQIPTSHSPPSNSLRATRKPDVLVLSEIAGKELVVVREGISTPNAPYLRNCRGALHACRNSAGASGPRAAATGGAWTHAPPRKDWDRGDPKQLPPLFTFLAGGDNAVTCKTNKNAASKSFFIFNPASLPSDLPSLEPACGWLDRHLPSSHFISATAVLSTAAMVMRSAPIQASVFCPFFTVLWPPFSFPRRIRNELLGKGRCCCWPVDGGWPRDGGAAVSRGDGGG
ncbi:hypothetical protein NC651_010063 [Populus alba x Populus x berolinensis]|nr:hypothetical protein NC651_010063 [Populus alba x Populus x berolinensis]